MADSDRPLQYQKPSDGPSTEFESDAWLLKLPRTIPDSSTAASMPSSKVDDHQGEDRETPPCNGLVLVTGWPPNGQDLETPYRQLIEAVRECFDEADLKPDSRNNQTNGLPATYLYPFGCLHVTIATFRDFRKACCSNDDKADAFWISLIQAASQSDNWPQSPLKLRVMDAQIGRKAGILLYRETSGGLEAIRRCIALEFDKKQAMQETMLGGGDEAEKGKQEEKCPVLRPPSIPPIVHSTFVRFHAVPQTSGQDVQDRFQTKVLPRIQRLRNDEESGLFFPGDVQCNNVMLVRERYPYMHVPYDEQHVCCEFPLLRHSERASIGET